MEHPNPEIRNDQKKFLSNLPEDQRDLHARMFRTGNAAIHYHQRAIQSEEPTKDDFKHWLEGLPDTIRRDMEDKGFEQCKTHLPFTRHVMEHRNIGMDAWMKDHLSEEDYNFWTSNALTKNSN